MKSHDKVRSLHGSETEGACFLGDYFKIKYPKKSNEESIHYELFWKKMLLKRIAGIKVFSKIIVLKIETSRNGLYKI